MLTLQRHLAVSTTDSDITVHADSLKKLRQSALKLFQSFNNVGKLLGEMFFSCEVLNKRKERLVRCLTTSTSWEILSPKRTLMVSLACWMGRTQRWYPWKRFLRRASSISARDTKSLWAGANRQKTAFRAPTELPCPV